LTVRLLAEALCLDDAEASALAAAATRSPQEATRHSRRSRGGRGLPRELSSFIGRKQQLEALRNTLPGTPLLTLTGAGGVGKTRLALRLAAEFDDTCSDAVQLVELASLADPALVPQAVGQTLGVPERSGQAPVDALCIWLRDRRMLLLLDNCEHLVVGCAQLADVVLRRCTHLRVLATSREPLGVSGEVVWRVPSLRVPEAGAELDADRFSQVESVQLFEQRAMENLPGFQLTAEIARSVARICRQLDGIPLPIELAAARVRALSVEQIAERLTDRFELLNAGMRTAPARQHTLQAAIEWSYALLTDAEQRLFDRLAVFAVNGH
jgi:predicted ATPase